MFKTKELAKAVRFALLGGAVATAMTSLPILAAEGEEVERIEVTGSRLKRTDMETPVPVTVITRDQISKMGAVNVADVLNTSPVAIATSNQTTSTFSTTTVGLNTTALRNLGESRTLVLVNGRRFVSGVDPSTGYAVDLNAIPAAMIERIEILKSASSAIYGSDAVAGVVNIITRKDFEGVEVNAQGGTSGEGDRNTGTATLTAGKSWSGGSGWTSFGYDIDDGLKATDRDFSKHDSAIFLDENGNEYVDNLFSSYPNQGRITYKDSTGVSHTVNADGSPYSGGFDRASYRQLVTPLERYYGAAGFNTEITETVKLWSELNYNTSKTLDSTIEPVPLDVVNDVWNKDRGGTAGLDVNSPLLPDSLRDQLIADGITNLNQTTFVRRMGEFGPRSTDVERSTIRLATGLDWEINSDWTAGAYVTWGKTEQNQEDGGQVNVERAAQALDVIELDGKLVCRDELARLQGCVPLNMFGEGTISADAVNYIKVPAKAYGRAEQKVFALSTAGVLPLELSGGQVGLAGGFEWREENGQFKPGDLAQTGASSTNGSEPTDGTTRTNDIFAELSLPVLDNATISAAGRYTDHNVVGGNFTWNLGAEYSPIDELKLRASAATAVRTPNISDLYAGRGETFATVTDPCNGVDATTTGQEAENCRAIPEVAARIASEGSFELTPAEVQGTGGYVGGNPNVKEETADSWSVGAIWQAMDNLSFTVDYFDYSIKDAIATTDRSTVLDRCFAASSSTFSANCNGATVRDENGALIEVNSGTSNENNLYTSGLDLESNYNLDVGPGTFRAQLVYTYTREYVEESVYDGSSIDYAGEVLYPEHRANLDLGYEFSDYTFGWTMRYWGSVVDSVNGQNYNFTDYEALTTYNSIDAVIYHDLSAGYQVTDGLELYAGVRNLFDKQPPMLPQGTVNGDTGANTAAAAYDVTGRYYYAGVTAKF